MLSYELKEETLAYIQERTDLEELEEWLVPRLPVFMSFAPSPDSELAAAIELGLAELSAGITTEDELRRSLMALVSTEPTVLVFPFTRFETGSSNMTWRTAPVVGGTEPVFTELTWL